MNKEERENACCPMLFSQWKKYQAMKKQKKSDAKK